MRGLMVVAALMALASCGETNPAPPDADALALPAGFPQSDLAGSGAACIVYLGLSAQAGATPGGYDAPIMQQAADQWRASLQIDGGMSEMEIEQLVASSVNPLTSTQAEQRDAASAWCVLNAPEPDPSN